MHQLTIEREFSIPVSELFNAWSNIDVIARWFAPGDMTVPHAEVDLKEGGNYQIVMQDPDGSQHIIEGHYLNIEKDKNLTFSWQWKDSPTKTKVQVDFTSIDEQRSKLSLLHTEFPDQEMCDKHQMGWNGCLDNLNKLTEVNA
ncbi:SRPBCC domain-containing protein [Pleionea sp. CnH1-48]|uniref:SRPBCC family protein n=1 Tax=Pleionea sp. CnH1-48 TaxID=2954494 RepID=UPI002097666D|nr:SRPBCC domain-containing protein [Pleionea sp. CnH1-48]MCO7226388.1 SRPBCC domain-containing protein [Pleionea sp. CnH1-48]